MAVSAQKLLFSIRYILDVGGRAENQFIHQEEHISILEPPMSISFFSTTLEVVNCAPQKIVATSHVRNYAILSSSQF